jgi:hypothetical protein
MRQGAARCGKVRQGAARSRTRSMRSAAMRFAPLSPTRNASSSRECAGRCSRASGTVAVRVEPAVVAPTRQQAVVSSLPAQGRPGPRARLPRRVARTGQARPVDPLGTAFAPRAIQARRGHDPRTCRGHPRVCHLRPLERQNRRPQRLGAHHHAARLRLSQRSWPYRPTHAVLLRHSPRSRSPLAEIHPLNLVENQSSDLHVRETCRSGRCAWDLVSCELRE